MKKYELFDIIIQTECRQTPSIDPQIAIQQPYYFIADSYYASKVSINFLTKQGNNHLITRVRSNTIGYRKAQKKKILTRGRKAIYGKKIKLKTLFDKPGLMRAGISPVYVKLKYRCNDLY